MGDPGTMSHGMSHGAEQWAGHWLFKVIQSVWYYTIVTLSILRIQMIFIQLRILGMHVMSMIFLMQT